MEEEILNNQMDMKEKIKSDLIACKKAFDFVGIPWVITDGIVLGYARYKDIMAWDTDVDMAVVAEITDIQLLQLFNALRAVGFQVGNEKTDFIFAMRETTFNGWLFHKNGDYYEAFPKSTPGVKFVDKAQWYDEPQMVDFLGDKFPMPNHMNDYLNCQYGIGWETNIVKNHEEFFIYKRGGRELSTWTTGRCSKDGNLWPKILKIEDDIKDLS